MNCFIVFFAATIACINAAPVETSAENGAESDIAQIKAALQPVHKELRALYDNANFAVKDLTELAAKSTNDLSASAKQIINPADRSASHNIIAEAKSLANEAQDSAKNFVAKAIEDYEPIKSNERSALITSRDALGLLGNKYLTQDGQELVKALTGAARKATFV